MFQPPFQPKEFFINISRKFMPLEVQSLTLTFASLLSNWQKKQMKINYLNGSYIGAEKSNLIDLELIENSIIEVRNVGTPFRGGPKEMVVDALAHVVNRLFCNKGILPIIYQSSTGTDKYGIYTTDVIFQAVFPFPY